MRNILSRSVFTAAVMICFLGALATDSLAWTAAQRLNDPSENQGSVKEPSIYPAAGGGFHAAYRYFAPGAVRMQYRLYQSGQLGPIRTLATGTLFGHDVVEAGNGDLHMVWENWDATPDIGWSRSTNGGVTWSSPTEITNFGNVGKFPYLAHYGSSSGGTVVMSCGRADGKDIWYNVFDGTSWNGFGAYTGYDYESEYEIHGMCRSLQDGTVYRANDNSGNQLVALHYNGTTWSQNVAIPQSGFYPRMSIAVNVSGQIMLTWEENSNFYSKLYTPGSGWGGTMLVQSGGGFGDVTAIPGTNEFYAAYCKDTNRVRGKRFSGGAWGAEEIISVNQPWDTTFNARVAAGADGSLYACWEYWGEGDAQAFFSVSQAGPPPPSGTISGTVTDQFGNGVEGVAVNTSGVGAAVSGIGGTYSLSQPVGTYTVTASKAYYTTDQATGVSVTQGNTTTVNFVINGSAPAAVTNFAVTGGNQSNSLLWNAPGSGNYSGTMVRYRTDTYPTSASDGTLVTDVAGSPGQQHSFAHNGLTNGTTYYYSAFAYFDDASRFYAGGDSAEGTPAGPADLDHDGDVDQKDHGLFQACRSGSGIAHPAGCEEANLHGGDNDVDNDDYAVFIGCVSGPNNPADPFCAP